MYPWDFFSTSFHTFLILVVFNSQGNFSYFQITTQHYFYKVYSEIFLYTPKQVQTLVGILDEYSTWSPSIMKLYLCAHYMCDFWQLTWRDFNPRPLWKEIDLHRCRNVPSHAWRLRHSADICGPPQFFFPSPVKWETVSLPNGQEKLQRN